MSDDKEQLLKRIAKVGPPAERKDVPRREFQRTERSKDLLPNQEVTADDLYEGTATEEEDWDGITRLADQWHVENTGSLKSSRNTRQTTGQVDSLHHCSGYTDLDPCFDITADFPTSSNPFKGRTEAALINIARSPSTSLATLKWLAGHADVEVRKAVAANPVTPSEILRGLSREWDGTIRLAVLDNPKVPIDIITELSSDINPLVSLRACYALDQRRERENAESAAKTPSPTIKDMPNLQAYQKYLHQSGRSEAVSAQQLAEAIEFLKMVASKPTTPPERLSELSLHPSPEVRAAVAQNYKAPLEVLWRFLCDQNPMVKERLTHNESCPVELLRELVRDENAIVKQNAQQEITKIERQNNSGGVQNNPGGVKP